MNGDEKGATQMRDYFNEMFEWDGNVPRKKKKQVLPDGARANFKMQMMDHAGDFIPIFADGTPDHTSPHRPGHRFADVNDEARLVANDAYEERRQRLHYANKRGRQDGAGNHGATPDLHRLRELADAAYEDRRQRMANAWRNR
jgi:hypothetical protein